MLKTKEKVIGGIAILILLLLLFRKKLTGMVSAKVLDPNTGIAIGYQGIRQSSNVIGEVLLPPGVPNDITSSAFQYTVKNVNTNLCPIGYSAVIDPDTNAAYCIVTGAESIGG